MEVGINASEEVLQDFKTIRLHRGTNCSGMLANQCVTRGTN